jgi:hypothetical protein
LREIDRLGFEFIREIVPPYIHIPLSDNALGGGANQAAGSDSDGCVVRHDVLSVIALSARVLIGAKHHRCGVIHFTDIGNSEIPSIERPLKRTSCR